MVGITTVAEESSVSVCLIPEECYNPFMTTDIGLFVKQAAVGIAFKAKYAVSTPRMSEEQVLERLERLAADILRDEVGVTLVAEEMDALEAYSGPGVAIEYEIANLAQTEIGYECLALRKRLESMGAKNDNKDTGECPGANQAAVQK